MKTGKIKFRPVGLILALSLLNCLTLFAQTGGSFSITSSVIGNGGGQMSGGSFSHDKTIAETIAGTTSTGGTFSSYSGFWIPADSPAGTISGTVTYGNAAVPPKYISNVTVTG